MERCQAKTWSSATKRYRKCSRIATHTAKYIGKDGQKTIHWCNQHWHEAKIISPELIDYHG